MASVIKSIAFNNFYNFYGDFENNTFTFSEGLNIINADNGMGKSKMYNGFLWIIKDMVYDSDLREPDGVVHSAIKIASEKAKNTDEVVDFGVRLVFEDDRKEYTITKSIKLTKDYASEIGWKVSLPRTDVLELDLLTHNSAIVYDLARQEEIIKVRLLSATMQPYSLLQGEAIDSIVDLTDSSNLASTVEALTDLSELKIIEKTCKTLYSGADKDLSTKQKACAQNKKGFDDAQAEKANILKQIKGSEESIELYKKELQQATEEADKYKGILANTEKRVEYREKLIALRTQLGKKEKELESLLSSINDNLFAKNPLPWLLYGTEGYVDAFIEKRAKYTEAMLAKKVLANPEALLASILPEGSPDDASLSKMLEECRCFVCNRPFTKDDEHYKHVEMLRNRSLKKPTTDDAKFKAFFGDIQKTVSPFMTVDTIFASIASSIKAQKAIENEIKTIHD